MLVCSGVVHQATPDSSGTLGMHAGLASTSRWLSSKSTVGTNLGPDDSRQNVRRSTAATLHASMWRWPMNRESMVVAVVVGWQLLLLRTVKSGGGL